MTVLRGTGIHLQQLCMTFCSIYSDYEIKKYVSCQSIAKNPHQIYNKE